MHALPPRTPAERAFARTVVPMTANRLTSDLAHVVGRHVSLVCGVITIVRPDTFIGQCGTAAEPVDMYVSFVPGTAPKMTTAALRVGDRLRVLGAMATPPVWVDATGHSWYTALVDALFVDRL